MGSVMAPSGMGGLVFFDNTTNMSYAKRATVFLALALLVPGQARSENLPWIAVAKDGKGFALSPSGDRFIPRGFNYDHDEQGRLIEDYWELEWGKIEEDFREMKEL